MATTRIKSTHPETQGEFIVIEVEDFDPETMEYFEASDAPKRGRGRPPKATAEDDDTTGGE